MKTRVFYYGIILCLFSNFAESQIVEVDYRWVRKKINDAKITRFKLYESFDITDSATGAVTQKFVESKSTINAGALLYRSKFVQRVKKAEAEEDETPLTMLKNGLVDYLTDGTVQASAQFIKINIGEKDFSLPFYIYTGTGGKGFGSTDDQTTSVSNLLNQIGGTVNFSVNKYYNLLKKNDERLTLLKFNYQIGGRIVNGKDSVTKENVNFFNAFANAGFYFQTGAWANDDLENIGVFFIQAKLTGAISSENNLSKVLGPRFAKNSLFGYSVDAGIEINDVLNIHAGVYQFVNSPIQLLKDPVVKFSMNYKLH